MKWLASVRAALAGGSRSAPVTPAASPNLPSKADLRAKQVSCYQNSKNGAEQESVPVWNSFSLCVYLSSGFLNQSSQLIPFAFQTAFNLFQECQFSLLP